MPIDVQPGGSGGITVGYCWFFHCPMRIVPAVATASETQVGSSVISGWTAKTTSATALFEWQNSGAVIARTKAAVVAADTEL